MRSFLARHTPDKKAEGFNRGEKGYPSGGRVAWDAWGGDAAESWARSIVERVDKSFDYLAPFMKADDKKFTLGPLYIPNKLDAHSEWTDEEELQKFAAEQLARMQQANQSTLEEISAAVLVALAVGDEEEKSLLLRAALIAIFLNLLSKRRRAMAEHEAQTSYNAGGFMAGKSLDAGVTKTWLTRKDSRVRNTHQFLEGKTVDFGDGFMVDGIALRFPGDPLAPPALTFNCRCRLRFRFD